MTMETGGVARAGRAGRADFGVDAPYVPVGFGLLAVVFGVLLVVSLVLGWGVGLVIWWAAWLVLMLLCAASYLYTTRRGKVVVWDRLVAGLGLAGGERVLDMGCGRGLVLLAVAARLSSGRAVGVDLWRSGDQSANAEETTRRNAVAVGVSDRVELHTGDMTELPFGDGEFDVVVSSAAVHNISSAQGRSAALGEAARVLRPGGRLLVADIRHVGAYADDLRALGWSPVTRGLGWRFWYGGPWVATRLVSGTKPSSVGGQEAVQDAGGEV